MKYVITTLLICFGAVVQAGGENIQGSSQDANEAVVPAGHYYGVGWQRDGQHWSIDLLLNADGGQIAYPSLECTGKWSFKSDAGDHVEYIEQILEGIEDCLELGTVHLAPLDSGNFSYTWYENEPAVEARAVLIPVDGKRMTYMEQLMLTLGSIDTGFMYPEYIE